MKYIKGYYEVINESNGIADLLLSGGFEFDLGLQMIKDGGLGAAELRQIGLEFFSQVDLLEMISRTGETYSMGREEGATLDEIIELCRYFDGGIGSLYFKKVYDNEVESRVRDAERWDEDPYPVSVNQLKEAMQTVWIGSGSMRSTGQTELPSFILGLSSTITMLYIDGLSQVADWIGALKGLKRVYLSGSATRLPDTMAGLTEITTLVLDFNLDEVPYWIRTLPNLTDLNLSYNKNITTLPEWISSLKLDSLSLSYTGVSIEEAERLAKLMPGCKISHHDDWNRKIQITK